MVLSFLAELAAKERSGELREELHQHRAVGRRVESAPLLAVGKCDPSDLGAVELAAGEERAVAKCCDDVHVGGQAGADHTESNLVHVDDAEAPTGRRRRDGGLAAGDAASEADDAHRTNP